jgi:hypothetical protein
MSAVKKARKAIAKEIDPDTGSVEPQREAWRQATLAEVRAKIQADFMIDPSIRTVLHLLDKMLEE